MSKLVVQYSTPYQPAWHLQPWVVGGFHSDHHAWQVALGLEACGATEIVIREQRLLCADDGSGYPVWENVYDRTLIEATRFP